MCDGRMLLGNGSVFYFGVHAERGVCLAALSKIDAELPLMAITMQEVITSCPREHSHRLNFGGSRELCS